MKKVNTASVNPCGKILKGEIASAIEAPEAGTMILRGSLTVILSIILFFTAIKLNAQNCPTIGNHTMSVVNENTYYPGLNASLPSGSTSITLGAAGAGLYFGNSPIVSGDIVFIIQMQGAQIQLPASNQSSLYGANASTGSGMIAANLMAGKMEFAVAASGVGIGGGVLTLAAGLTNSYANTPYTATSGKYTYQVIRVPQYFNIQLTGTINTPQWNGTSGGVTIISAVNQLDFNGQTVTALGSGFRGGGSQSLGGNAALNKLDFYVLSTSNADAGKGEGIAGTPRYIYYNGAAVDNGAAFEGYPGGSYARGAPANAGGGGTDSHPVSNDQNSGGGGGGNGGTGGLGGNGWQSFGFSGGHGGSPFQTQVAIAVVPFWAYTNYYSPSCLIMGGGGGGGTTNNATGTPGGGAASSGASGGGIVIINSSTIIGVGKVNASGGLPNNTVINDGSGGAGAGGSILIYANSGQAGITATADGGTGASNSPGAATQHGPGGGGGGGVIFSNAALNIASSVNLGLAGISYGSAITDSSFGAKPGTVGVLTQTFPFSQLPPNMQICQTIVLPVTILSFNATYESANNVKVSWTTTDEINAAYYEVERSTDATNFIGVAQMNASESVSPVHSYSINDQLYNISGNIVYYRLRVVDQDGKYTYSKIIPLKLGQPENVVSVYPNPVDNYAILNLFSDKSATGMLRLLDNSGKQIITKSFSVMNGTNSILIDQLGFLPKGIYIIQVMVNNNLYNQKIIKK